MHDGEGAHIFPGIDYQAHALVEELADGDYLAVVLVEAVIGVSGFGCQTRSPLCLDYRTRVRLVRSKAILGCLTDLGVLWRSALWGSQSWLQPPFRRLSSPFDTAFCWYGCEYASYRHLGRQILRAKTRAWGVKAA